MKQAIINYINARAERLRPCKHKWKLLLSSKWSNAINKNYIWEEYTYRCTKCCESKRITTDKYK